MPRSGDRVIDSVTVMTSTIYHATAAFNAKSGTVPSKKEIKSAASLMVQDIKALADRAGFEVIVDTTNKDLGTVALKCHEDLVPRIRALPRVARVTEETSRHLETTYSPSW